MYDASVAFLSKIGVPRVKLLGYLESMLSKSSFFENSKVYLGNVAREDGLNPEINYVLGIGNETWYASEENPTVVVQLVTPSKGIFVSDALDETNWVIDLGTSDLTLDEITFGPMGNSLNFAFTGTAVAGEISIQGKNSVALNNVTTAEVVYTIYESIAYDPTIPYEFETASTIDVDDVDPSLDLTVSVPTGGLFAAGAETLANWTIDAGTTDLTADSATLNVDSTELTFAFTGTAVAGTITISGNENVTVNGVSTASFTFTITA